MGFSGYDIFKVEKDFTIGGGETNSMTKLYMPIIGVDGFSLYFLLTTLKKQEEYQISKLMDNLGFSNPLFLEEAINKLEAIGLIKTYYNKENGYLFVINEPLSIKSFLNNHILYDFLKSKIGSTEISKIKKEIKKEAGYKEITKAFDEVYKRDSVVIKNILPSYFKELAKDNIEVKNNSFDYTYFKLMFDTNFIGEELFEDKKFKDEILKISYHYGLSEEEMYQAVMDTIKLDKDLKLEDINKRAVNIYSAKRPEPITFTPKESISLKDSELDEATARFLDLVEKISCEELLKTLSGIKASVSELKLFDDLMKATGFSQGVINVMVLYVTNEKNGEIPSYNYFEKIANTWKRAKVKTAKDALDVINKKPEEKKTTNYSKKAKVKEVPDWYKDYEKTISEASNKNVSEDEKSKALEEAIASGLFSSHKE